MVKDKKKSFSDDSEIEIKNEDLDWIYLADSLDLDKNPYQVLTSLFFIRFGMSMLYGSKCFHPDQNW